MRGYGSNVGGPRLRMRWSDCINGRLVRRRVDPGSVVDLEGGQGVSRSNGSGGFALGGVRPD